MEQNKKPRNKPTYVFSQSVTKEARIYKGGK